MKEVARPERDIMYLKLLKEGKRPGTVMRYAVDNFGVTESTAHKEVSLISGMLKKEMEELKKDAAEYIMSTLVGSIETLEKSPALKLKALEQLAKVCKVYDEKPSVTLNNFGFKFGDDEQ